ncbi:hypothetical protein Q9966_016345 [Columba livia]|nr:hypothetical protein Q9966_016345 [Columba livia]
MSPQRRFCHLQGFIQPYVKAVAFGDNGGIWGQRWCLVTLLSPVTRSQFQVADPGVPTVTAASWAHDVTHQVMGGDNVTSVPCDVPMSQPHHVRQQVTIPLMSPCHIPLISCSR